MSSTNETSSSGRQSRAPMGNFGNDNVDRSEETVLTRRQKRQQRRETLRLQAEVAPFLDMDLDSVEDTKDKEVAKVEKKNEAENKEELGKNMIGTPLDTIFEVDESTVEEEAEPTGLRPDSFKTPPSGQSEFPGHEEKWWTRGVMGISIRNSLVSRFS